MLFKLCKAEGIASIEDPPISVYYEKSNDMEKDKVKACKNFLDWILIISNDLKRI
jgi:hypothetical protein